MPIYKNSKSKSKNGRRRRKQTKRKLRRGRKSRKVMRGGWGMTREEALKVIEKAKTAYEAAEKKEDGKAAAYKIYENVDNMDLFVVYHAMFKVHPDDPDARSDVIIEALVNNKSIIDLQREKEELERKRELERIREKE